MLFNSLGFALFFPIVCIGYFALPGKHNIKNIWLLTASYFFYMNWNAKYALLLLFSTFVTYICARFIDHYEKKPIRKGILITGIVLNLLLLIYFKYYNFLLSSLNGLIKTFGGTGIDFYLDIILPVGISFFIFQSLGYMIDVYCGRTKIERNFFIYALFVSFFPQLVAGPIERSNRLISQFYEKHRIDLERIKDGLLLMLYGYFLKLVLADRIAIFVDAVYSDMDTYDGIYVVIASILFAFQIYCDFAGYSTIAIGAAKVMGFSLMDNFNGPYLASSVAEFWRRWHISLSTWFKDYVYIPLGGSRCSVWRKDLNVMIVFLLSGLWHGADWTYVIWGGLNGLFQIIGRALDPFRNKIRNFFGYDTSQIGIRVLRMIATFFLIDFTWIFFRAESIKSAFAGIKSIFTVKNWWVLFDGSLYGLGLNEKNYHLMWAGIAILMLVDMVNYKGMSVRKIISKQILPVRWFVYIASMIAILVFGIWGPGYDATTFIYFAF